MADSGNYVTIPLAQEKAGADTLLLEVNSDEQLQTRLARLQEEEAKLKAQQATIEEELRGVDKVWEMRRAPVVERLDDVLLNIEAKKKDIEIMQAPKVRDMPPAPGPEFYGFVDSEWFHGLCNLVICMNLLTMYYEDSLPTMLCFVLYQVYLAWYVFELASRFRFHRYNLFCGRVSVTWPNYLDATIVVSGVADQWIGAGLRASGVLSGNSGVTHRVVQCLRVMRIFRLIRLLKLVKELFLSDLAFTTTAEFEFIVALVIGVNSVVMGAELQYPSPKWVVAENVFLVIYFVELAATMKREGLRQFFTDPEFRFWHWLDFTIVAGGVLDLWIVPVFDTIHGDHKAEHKHASSILKLMRMMRLLRVLRLAKLLKKVPPLHRLLIGVIEAIDSMKWVIVLTVLIIYACAVIFCSVVSQGLLFHKVPDSAMDSFGDMYKSMYSLFSLMNGEMSVIDGLNERPIGKFLSIGFIVVSNWAILAILTSVVSDNLFRSSQRLLQAEEDRVGRIRKAEKRQAMLSIFRESDSNNDGTVREHEWEVMWSDEGRRRVLEESSGLDKIHLDEMYELTNKKNKGTVPYKEFTTIIEDHSRTADIRSIIQVLGYLQDIPHQEFFDKRFADLETKVNVMKMSGEWPGNDRAQFSTKIASNQSSAHSMSSMWDAQAISPRPEATASSDKSASNQSNIHFMSNMLDAQVHASQSEVNASSEMLRLNHNMSQETVAELSERLTRLIRAKLLREQFVQAWCLLSGATPYQLQLQCQPQHSESGGNLFASQQ